MSDFNNDETLLDAVAETYAIYDPVPESAIRFALESRRLLSLESELAELASDSLVDADNSRSNPQLRTVELKSTGMTIRLECEEQIAGTVEPFPDGSVLRVEYADGNAEEVEVSSSGFFLFDAPSSAFRLVVAGDGLSVTTDWIQM